MMNANDKLGAYVLLAMHGFKKDEIKDIMKKVESDMKNKEGAE
ncbi:hypothetical protein ACMXZI_17670 [Bacillus subtilis]|nr:MULTISPECIES: hypothetical protein [Bacillus]MDF4200441.1 hypothetical protein [Bacillus subtilis]MDF4218700.1 hypothetical protein [Bacillus subtilis]MEC1271531.1 hypothetical protein [Bacillus subtilis]MEC1317882.1 hypothetical protein [Bacillus subtilis]MEC2401580.1 hypothetical protein [Bacillus subtilis]